MDAIKMISQDSMKAELPQFSIGDTVRVDVNIREGDGSVSSSLKALSSPARAAASARPSLCGVFPMA